MYDRMDLFNGSPFRTLGSFPEPFGGGGRNLPVDIVRYEDRIEIELDVPGVDPSALDINVDGRDLTVSFERQRVLPEGAQLVSEGRAFGEFSRVLHLGEQLDPSGIEAEHVDGVLTLTIPVSEAAKPRKIEVGKRSELSA